MNYDFKRKRLIDEDKNKCQNYFDRYSEEAISSKRQRYNKNSSSRKQKAALILFIIILISVLSGFFIGFKVGIYKTAGNDDDNNYVETDNSDTDDSSISQE